MPQPLITTSMLWDDDINPEGLAEQWKHTFTFDLGGGGGEAVQSYSKGGYSKEGKSRRSGTEGTFQTEARRLRELRTVRL